MTTEEEYSETKYLRVKVVGRSRPEVQFRVRPSTRMGRLTASYSSQAGLALHTLAFFYGERMLREEDTASELGLQEGDIIRVVSRKPGVGAAISGLTTSEQAICLKFRRQEAPPEDIRGWKLLKDWTLNHKVPEIFYVSPEGKKFRSLQAANRFIAHNNPSGQEKRIDLELNIDEILMKQKLKMKKNSIKNPLRNLMKTTLLKNAHGIRKLQNRS